MCTLYEPFRHSRSKENPVNIGLFDKNRPETHLSMDQGSQFTSAAFTERVLAAGAQCSMDGRGRCLDNVFIERLWQALSNPEMSLKRVTRSSLSGNRIDGSKQVLARAALRAARDCSIIAHGGGERSRRTTAAMRTSRFGGESAVTAAVTSEP